MIRNAKQVDEVTQRLAELDRKYFTRTRPGKEAQGSYAAGESSRMSPMPRGVDPMGTDADYHYRTERNYFLMVERGRAAARNHPLVEQGVNRAIANLRLDQFTLDVNSGNKGLDEHAQGKFIEWAGDKSQCDFEQQRTFDQIVMQSYFSEVIDGDILHLPLDTGQLQTWESHHIRTPWGHRPTGSDQDGIVHGAEVRGGATVAYHITPHNLAFHQGVRRNQTRRYPVYSPDGSQQVFWSGFTHRFFQRRGISRLAAPQDAMTGFDDLNYAHIKTALRRALVSYLMKSNQAGGPPGLDNGQLPQSGERSTEVGLGVESIVVENQGEPAQVFKVPEGWDIDGWNANMPGSQFFEHAGLMLTMLAVNLDLPLMFLLMDGSLVNFHGGRMTFDQMRLRAEVLQKKVRSTRHDPVYRWKLRQWSTPGSAHFDPTIAAGIAKGHRPDRFEFRPAGWPYVKPLEDAAAEDLAERRNLKSLRAILAGRGVDIAKHRGEVIPDRADWMLEAIKQALRVTKKHPDLGIDVMQLAREFAYGVDTGGVQLSLNAGGEDEPQMNNVAGPPEPQE